MIRPVLIGFAVLLGLATLYFFGEMVLLVFAAVLIAAVFDAAVILQRRILPIPRVGALLVSLLVFTATIAVLLVTGGLTLPGQIEALTEIFAEAWVMVARQLNAWGVTVSEEIELSDVLDAMPEPQTMFGGAGAVLGTGLGILSNIIIVMIMGVFLAANPARYRDGLVLLAPREQRERLAQVLDRMGRTLQRWMVGQFILMLIVGGSTLVLLLVVGVEYAFLLALIVGLLNFIPFVGPILGFVPIGLTMIGQDWTTALIVLGGYTVIQQADGNIFSPLIQDQVVRLAPALTIAFLLFMGVAFGPIGVILATPVLAAIRIAVLELYVADVLGDHQFAKSRG